MLSGILYVFVILSSFQNISCEDLSDSYGSLREAENKILAAEGWKIIDYEFTPNSSWMKGASYRSCDSQFGYLIIARDYDPLIHSLVEVRVWNEFKSKSSKDLFYKEFLKDKHNFRLNKPEEPRNDQ